MEYCGYHGHVCQQNTVQFISRYRNQNDYCVSGNRVTIYDDGAVRRGTPEQIAAVRLFELRKYAEYCQWHAEYKAKNGGEFMGDLLPFTFATA